MLKGNTMPKFRNLFFVSCFFGVLSYVVQAYAEHPSALYAAGYILGYGGVLAAWVWVICKCAALFERAP